MLPALKVVVEELVYSIPNFAMAFILTLILVVFTNVAAYTKHIIDVDDGRRPYSKTFTRDQLLQNFHGIPLKSGMQKNRPEISEFYLRPSFMGRKKRSQAKQAKFDPNDNDIFGCEAPPGVDVNTKEAQCLYDVGMPDVEEEE